MKINVKLYGVLERDFSGYDPSEGMTLEFSDGARVKDLLAHLKIPESKGYFVSINNTIARPDDKLPENGTVLILPSLAGG